MHDNVALAAAELAGGRDEVLLFYRAEQVSLSRGDDKQLIMAEFSEAAPIAGRVMITAIIGKQRVSGLVADYPLLRAGDRVGLAFNGPPDAVFATSGERIQSCV